MTQLNIRGHHNILKAGFYIPNRLSKEAVRALNRLLDNQVCYLVDPTFPPAADILEYLNSQQLHTEYFNFRRTTSRAVREQVLAQMQQGKCVIFLPGLVARTRGTLTDIPSPFLSTVGSLHIAPVPVFLGYYGHTMETVFSDSKDGCRQELCILPQLAPGPKTGERLLRAWMDQSAELFCAHPWVHGSLTTELVRAIKRHPQTEIIDGMTGSTLPFYKLLGVAMCVCRHLKQHYPEHQRIGIILPPGPGAVIATLACLLAGITPVMVNYASSRDAISSTARQSGISRLITARKFREKLPSFPWPAEEQLILMEDLLKKLSKASLVSSVLWAKVAPAWLICKLFDTDRHRDEHEGIILFTSGTSGEPKGVVLSHRMLLANAAQCASRLDLRETRFLACLPIFHSFGLTVTMLLPLLSGRPFCAHPNPTDARALCAQIEKYKLTLLCATPTFARAMLRRAKPHTFLSVRHWIVGAEKLPPELEQEFRELHQVELLEGYGLTEASPVCAVNLPDAPPVPGSAFYIPGTVKHSVGSPLPGIAVRITDVNDDARELPLTEQGMLWLKGANIFCGYLGRAELNSRIFRDGWFKTGDVGRVDLNGFITLNGRLSRFSKIGGEMVPHEVLELAIARILNLSPESGLPIAVSGTSDPKKGEAIVLLSSLPEHQRNSEEKRLLTELRRRLAEQNIPNLWMPKYIIPVESIPRLPTGKLDLRGCKLLTDEALKHMQL